MRVLERFFVSQVSMVAFWHGQCLKKASMKTFYVIKSFLPFIFLPIVPGMLQVELARQGFLTGGGAIYAIILQGIFTLGIIGWLARAINRKQEKAFLRMSCVSKKVYHLGKWMSVEQYLAENHNIVVSHGMTPEESQAWVADAEDYLRREVHVPELEETVA
jgi:hypothetical protein